jgi:hypothetical protein
MFKNKWDIIYEEYDEKCIQSQNLRALFRWLYNLAPKKYGTLLRKPPILSVVMQLLLEEGKTAYN